MTSGLDKTSSNNKSEFLSYFLVADCQSAWDDAISLALTTLIFNIFHQGGSAHVLFSLRLGGRGAGALEETNKIYD